MRLSGFSEVLPGEPVTNRDMAERFGLHEKWLDMMTGNRTRYFCRTDSPPSVPKNTSDLAVAAATAALADAGADVASLDFLVLTTASPDHLMPATVNLVADRIGLNDVPTFQLMSGCAGALTGLYTARALLASGLRRGLVIGADTCLKLFPSSGEIAGMSPAELINFALFGDGAGAVVVEADPDGPGLLVEHLFLRTTGMGRSPAQIARWFGTEGAPVTDGPDGPVREPWGEEDYKAIEHHVPEHAETIFKELTAETGWRLEDVEHVLLPQLNGVMTDGIRKRLGVRPEQAVNCVADTGNNGNAVPFVQLSRAMGRIRSGLGVGGRLLVANVESSKWILSGLALRHQDGAPR
ncbi:3-oxoacyl-[acyl-carrier-protein] synthase-3 [Streptomyces ambofaciens]|jgi:3-oxoacyl-[acyl-carrier-protein] synthase-3|uniref:3-oxoacyl-ACP synthase III family protein n=1 Tax=unclassified Streptomyces TaxID=2593676 RepID=UPI0007505052|nr:MULTISPECIES: 3-oxoacyl-ACP synthase III family protein [unclassified Streptomyces]MBQ0888920.1 3-oxoacyl-ACP synthase III family protein [Streptomyces sp. RM72]OMI87508.1 beta-ketoacyl-ACP reductase [Streptomyces sp. M1013]